jgi:hypothetical protein
MVVPNKADVRDEACEALPTRERLGVNDHSMNVGVTCQICVHRRT